MSQENNEKHEVIPVELIRETVMPPYPYQVFQNGFGRAGSSSSSEEKEVSEKTSKDGPAD
ncbi:MAG: hypothetical protein OXD45_13280 [Rhodobacteraceae bacterium]|nr:hypothetical protein [Paracoccaceae bacterium]MCY4309441.1 hypothetical protein [Paracoccaceae bacterium]